MNRAADLLGRRCGLWSERTEAAGSDVRIVDDVGAAGPEDGAAECSGAGKRGSRGEDGAAECGGAGRSAGKGKARRALNIRPAEIHTKSIPENGGAV